MWLSCATMNQLQHINALNEQLLVDARPPGNLTTLLTQCQQPEFLRFAWRTLLSKIWLVLGERPKITESEGLLQTAYPDHSRGSLQRKDAFHSLEFSFLKYKETTGMCRVWKEHLIEKKNQRRRGKKEGGNITP